VPAPEPAAYARQLVASLCSLDVTNSPPAPEKAAEWRQNLQKLLEQGAAAVPAIREFLARNIEANFGPNGAATLGYASARAALLDALAQIGGPEATAATFQALQAATDPRELAVLAQNLDKLAPEQFREQAVLSARQLLAVADAGALGEKDVAPLFEVLDKYGGAGVAEELQQVGARWRYYAAIALAQLPDGSGIPSLIRMAQPQEGSTIGSRDPALRMLAQLSSQYPDAREALLEQARQNTIPTVTWAAIAPILAGDQVGFLSAVYDATLSSADKNGLKTTHVAAGNQNFYSLPVPANLSTDQVNLRLDLIQQLLPLAADPTAVQALKNCSDLLRQRLSQSAAAPMPGS
jgi:hypothetical protein